MSTKFLSPGWRMPRNANQSKQSNYSMDFERASASYIDLGTIDITGSCTISFWINFNSISHAYQKIFFAGTSASDQFSIGFATTNQGVAVNTIFASGQEAAAGTKSLSNNSISTNTWYNIVITKTTGVVQNMYLNGVDDTNTPSGFWWGGAPNVTRIGDSGTGALDAKLNRVAIFDYVLTPSQVTTLWGGGTSVSNPMALPSPPIAYYPLGGSAGAFQTPVNNNDKWLIENNAIGDYVFDFDSSNNNYVDLNNAGSGIMDNQTSFSVSAWFKLNNNSATSAIMANWIGTTLNQYLLRMNGGQGIQWYTRVGSSVVLLNTNYLPNVGEWIHVVGVKDAVTNGGQMRVYINGFEYSLDNTVLSGALSANNTADTIGVFSNNVSFINGSMSNVAYWTTTALTQAEVTTLYNNGSPIRTLANIPQNSNLKAWYKLDASEVYNSSTTEWSIDNNQNPSAYPSSLDFNGTNDYITLPTITLTDNWSVSVWMNQTTLKLRAQAVGASNAVGTFWAYAGQILSGGGDIGKLAYYNGTGYITLSNNRLDDGLWHNWIITYDHSTTTLKCYIDGQENYSDTYNAGTGNTIDRISNNFASNYWLGQLSNISVWNTALTSTQITELYNNGTPSNLSSHSVTSNLVSWYKLNNTTTGIGNSLSPWTSSLNFDGGINNGITIQNDSSLEVSSQFTMSCWFKSETSQNSYAYPVYKASSDIYHAAYGFYLQNNVTLVSTVINTGSATPTILTSDSLGDLRDGKWHHVVQIYDGTQMKVYLDGNQSGSAKLATGTVDYSPTYQDLYIGKTRHTSPSGLYSFKGEVSNVQLFNTALPATGSNSVQTIYNIGVPLSDMSSFSSLVSWWKLNNTTTGVQDSKGSNNGTNNGATESIGLVSTLNGTNNGATEYTGFVNTLVGDSSGMSQSNLVQSDLQTVAPYSKYAIEFDHTDADYIDLTSDINLGSTFSFSVWLKTDHVNNSGDPQNTYIKNITGGTGFFKFIDLFGLGLSNGRLSNYEKNGINGFALSTNPLNDNIWHHCFVTFDGSTLKSYIDGSLNVTIEGITNWTSNILKKIGRYDISAVRYFDGILSNMAVWNSDLTASQAREVYNEGLPSNLHNFSGAAPVAWWQLGENSSYVGGWTFADEIGSNNGQGQNLTEINLTNGVGTTANGVSSGMSEGNLVGDAPYSTANAISSGMSVVSRVTGSGNTP